VNPQMNPNDVIEAYVGDVMRRVPARERNEIGLELRGLLSDMLADRAASEGRAVDDAIVLAMLRDFGTPADVAARYRAPGTVIIPAEQTRSFALWSVIGVGLQWALTLPRVFEGQPIVQWWFSWGLGSLWWPGFLVMAALIASGLRALGWFKPKWNPRIVDPERVQRAPMTIGLVWFAIGVVFMVCLPWFVTMMPAHLSEAFALDPNFLRQRAPFALPLWIADFALMTIALRQGRWMPTTARLRSITGIAWIALLSWWIAAGDIFRSALANETTRGALALVILIIVATIGYELVRRKLRIKVPDSIR
jgi:hypothetical protein